ncbi:MAG TPA: glycerophosphodiester phosphodiesterase family protein [Saprospiraceae bacterium]|nr:glycerophosphodiester phosphodiesterase family protein [Saprospiraceae bacterium]
MKYYSMILFFLLVASCKVVEKKQAKAKGIESFIQNLEDAQDKKIIVVAHRGDWRNAPENSLQAIENCIKMGVDMVEIDIQETKDGHLVLMHDYTIDRTTKATGYVKDWTLDSLKTLKLIDGLGVETNQKIPTLEEALRLCKDKILVNLDKSYDIFDKCYEVVQKTGTYRQVIIKGAKTRMEVEAEFGQYLDDVYFMPIIRLPNPDAKQIVDDYLDHRLPIAFEFTVKYDTIGFIKYFEDIREKGASVWVNSLWSNHNGGHDDEKAYVDPKVYDWFIKNNIDIIQTDRPQHLLDYLRTKGLHD